MLRRSVIVLCMVIVMCGASVTVVANGNDTIDNTVPDNDNATYSNETVDDVDNYSKVGLYTAIGIIIMMIVWFIIYWINKNQKGR